MLRAGSGVARRGREGSRIRRKTGKSVGRGLTWNIDIRIMTTKPSTCCADLLGQRGVVSPFSKIIAFGYYDGPTSGVAQCSECSSAYRFDIVGWDERQDVRVYMLAPLSKGVFMEIVNILSESDLPKWPVWVPRWDFASRKNEALTNAKIEGLLSSAGTGKYVLSTEDISRRILAVKPFRETDRKRTKLHGDMPDPSNSFYWLSYLATHQ